MHGDVYQENDGCLGFLKSMNGLAVRCPFEEEIVTNYLELRALFTAKQEFLKK